MLTGGSTLILIGEATLEFDGVLLLSDLLTSSMISKILGGLLSITGNYWGGSVSSGTCALEIDFIPTSIHHFLIILKLVQAQLGMS